MKNQAHHQTQTLHLGLKKTGVEPEAFKNDVSRIGKSKVADRAETNRSAAADWLLE
jgi:hypothetical protein